MMVVTSSMQPEQVSSKTAHPIVELVLWKPKEGISTEEAKNAILILNQFVEQQSGFISRKTGVAEDGQLIDIVLWTDLASAQLASEKVQESETCLKAFSTIDESTMHFQHYELFNEINN